MNAAHNFLFVVYPYICLAVFLMGSLARFDRDQYTWKSDSSQLLRSGSIKWASNLFHAGILFLFVGHSVGMLTPHAVYEHFISPANKQMLAIVAGGIAGTACFIGLSMLIWRRMTDPRIRLTSHRTDLAILWILWTQLSLGLVTLPFSLSHSDGSVMLVLSDWAQRIVTFNPDASGLVALAWPYKVHMVLGMTIFLLFPFSRLVHVWSGLASVFYVLRPYQVVRSRRLNLPKRG
ncbi:nitrate reductase gamma subunit [Pelomonas saccharophila]|uniref:Nitrate reductase gamma subunit n=1 Tax=Roseateles saccharophilus TaxID=304 RepID=A0ABU1YWI1_ROSSA|nr:respiratory nitrate reductase subunit gamma [Roseateles saccharophilus]MDR7272586.1 nitrate reductase gamma subunit [Roseateles saccharophilus]